MDAGDVKEDLELQKTTDETMDVLTRGELDLVHECRSRETDPMTRSSYGMAVGRDRYMEVAGIEQAYGVFPSGPYIWLP